jgi:oligosaccharyltransferase complex subunit beta
MRSIYSLTSLFIVSLLTALAAATSTTGHRILVLLDSLSDKDSYSQFWQQLQGNKTLHTCECIFN